MSVAVSLVDQLRLLGLLEPQQLEEVEQALQGRFPEPKELARELLQRNWLTAYQANQLLQGRGGELVLGAYILLEKLGEGGMGQVFKARHRTLGRVVALKLILKERLDKPDAVRRFHREIRAAAQLNHPNIVLAFDADEVAGTHFFTMEFVEGTDLAKMLKAQGPLPIADACSYMRQAGLGLQHAQERGLVHRDIKPANLLVARSGRHRAEGATEALPGAGSASGVIKILDMGLARMVHPDHDGDSSSTLTQEGSVMGSLDYLAPEQAKDSHKVDIRADLYSLGCTFYHLLTGRVPFPGGTAAEKIYKHQFEQPTPVEKLRPDLPPRVMGVVRKLMAKKPTNRYQSPAELVAALDTAMAALPGTASERPPARLPAEEAESQTEDLVPPAGAITQGSKKRSAPPASAGKRRPGPRVGPWLLAAAAATILFLAILGYGLFSGGSGQPAATNAQAQRDDQPPSLPPPQLATGRLPPVTAPAVPRVDPPPRQDFRPLPGKEYVTNSIGMHFVKVPAGSFLMGSPETEPKRDADEGPHHEVEITRPYFLGVYEVTQEQYEKVVGKNPSAFCATGAYKDRWAGVDTRRFPVDSVSWQDAQDFCAKLAELPEEKRAGRSYRLPTEAEWELACRAGTTTAYAFGDTITARHASGGDSPTTVGSYPPNAFGLYDMHRNVSEFCQDYYGPYSKDKQTDPQGPQVGNLRVVRGGSWFHVVHFSRSAARTSTPPGHRSHFLGFRLVVSGPAAPAGQSPAPKAFEKLPGKEYVTNSIGMHFVKVPAGKFLMGSPETEPGRSASAGPQHEVEITKPYYLGVYEVTQEQYEKVMGKNPSAFCATGANKDRVVGVDTREFPVDSVTWHDAQAFCARLAAVPGEKTAGRTYRLPTEAEWEYACRAGTRTIYASGDTITPMQANFFSGPNGRPKLVGSYLPNDFGLYDMHGNIGEACQDWYGSYSKDKQTDPQGPAKGTSRVVRGGYWNSGPQAAARRILLPAEVAVPGFGFRLVLVMPAAAPPN